MKKNKPATFFFREIEHAYHNDRPLYIGVTIFLIIFGTIALAIKLNS